MLAFVARNPVHLNDGNVVVKDGVEPPTRTASTCRSTIELLIQSGASGVNRTLIPRGVAGLQSAGISQFSHYLHG